VNDEARFDISATGFWTPGQRVFLDVRVFDLNAQRYRDLELKKCFLRNQNEKSKTYGDWVLNIENGIFTPLVFAANGGMARECILQASHRNDQREKKHPVCSGNGFGANETFIFVVTINATLLEGIEVLQHGPRVANRHWPQA